MSRSEPRPALSDGAPIDTTDLLGPADYPSHYAARTPDRKALICGERSWTYAEMDQGCDRLVSLLTAEGLRPGDRVGYVGRNSDLFYLVQVAALRLELVLVPLNWRNTAREQRFQLEDGGCRLVISDSEFAPIIRAAGVASEAILSTDDPEVGLRARLAAADLAPRRRLDMHKPSLLLYTSGTTGLPKGVLSTQYALAVQRRAEALQPAFAAWGDDEVLLSPLPHFHIGGISWAHTGLARGQTVVLTADASPANLLDLVLSCGVTRTFLVPTLVRALIEEMERRDLRVSSLRAIHFGAAPMDAKLLERALDRIGTQFLQYYGMTEACGSLTMLPPEDHDLARVELLRSVGRPLPGVSLAIRGPDKAPLEVNQPGEVWARCESLMLGYWERPDALAEAVEDGWYRTGDGGYLDQNGYLFLTDRIKDMVVTGGENVYPAEVEGVLREHPAVQDCAVFGIPDLQWGELVCAAVELRPGVAVQADELQAFARRSLAGYKAPRRYWMGATLPRTGAGKVQRAAAKAEYLTQANTGG